MIVIPSSEPVWFGRDGLEADLDRMILGWRYRLQGIEVIKTDKNHVLVRGMGWKR